jgi:hypothetical protein
MLIPLANSREFRIFASQFKKISNMKRVDFGTRDCSYPTLKEPKKKVFTSTKMADIFYEVQDEYWLDNDTYVIIFQDMVDVDGDTFHLEVEYHKDEERVTYTRVYEYENVEASDLVSPCFKKPIEEYILQKAGVISDDEFIITKEISVELKLAVPKGMTIGEFQEWLKESSIEVNRLVATDKEKLINKVKVLEIHNKGSK